MSHALQEGSPAARNGASPRPQLIGTRLTTSPFLSPEEQRVLEGALVSRSLGAGKSLVREGAREDNLIIVAEGWAYRYTTPSDGRRQIPALLVPGDIGNLDSLMFVRSDFGLRTLTPATIMTLPRDRALALAAQYPGIGRTFTWLALVENAILSQWALSLGRRSAKERLAHLLCELSVRLGGEEENEGESSFEFPLTQEVIADALGLTAVHVNRTMQQLRAEGLVVTANRTMTLPDVARLRQLGGFDPSYLHIEPPAESRLS